MQTGVKKWNGYDVLHLRLVVLQRLGKEVEEGLGDAGGRVAVQPEARDGELAQL